MSQQQDGGGLQWVVTEMMVDTKIVEPTGVQVDTGMLPGTGMNSTGQ